MQITDAIADLLTRIRNANTAKHDSVEIPASNIKKAITQILLDEGYIKGFTVIDDNKQGIIKITLKYGEGKTPVITGLKRVSKPGLRIYSDVENMPKVMKGLGVAIISTSKGVIKIARKYGEGKSPVITGLKRVSKPGLRIYSDVENMPKVMKGLGVAIISTSKGVMTDRQARKENVGGEVLAYIW